MTMQEIRARLDNLQHQIFVHSLAPKNLDELLDMRQEALDLKESFLNCSFIGTEPDVLEQIRVELVECELQTHIFASEAMYQNTSEQVRRLMEHYQSIQ
jgi:hypothetical protein